MGISERIAERDLRAIGLLVALSALVGVAAGVHPLLGLEISVGLAFAAVVIGNVAAGLCLFTVLTFVASNAGTVTKTAGLLLFGSWLAACAIRPARARRSLMADHPGLVWPAVALTGWALVSVAWAHSSGAVLTSASRFFLNALLLPIVFGAIRTRRDVLWLLGAFVVGATVSGVYGLLTEAGGRLVGSIGDSNEEAAVLLAGILLTAGLAGTFKRGSGVRLALMLAIGVMAYAMFATGSRGGLIAAGCALAAGVLFGGRWRGRLLAMLAVGGVAAALFVTVLASSEVQSHLTSADSSGRTDLWKVGIRMFEANPALGVGAGNFPIVSVHYVAQSGPLTRADLIVDTPKITHNVYLQLLDELGPLGLGAFALVVLAALRAGVQAARRFELAGDVELELIARMAVLALVGFLVADFFISDEFAKQLWLMFGLAASLCALSGYRRADAG